MEQTPLYSMYEYVFVHVKELEDGKLSFKSE